VDEVRAINQRRERGERKRDDLGQPAFQIARHQMMNINGIGFSGVPSDDVTQIKSTACIAVQDFDSYERERLVGGVAAPSNRLQNIFQSFPE
jgi:hypothetical protein